MNKNIKFLAMTCISFFLVSSVQAEWREVSYQTTLAANMPYCSSQKDVEDMVGHVIDGNDRQLNFLIDSGKCNVSSRMNIQVFQQNEDYVTFMTPSGNVFRTLRSFLKKQ